jgi:DNA adenine methylase
MHKGFDHDLFAERCNGCSIDMAISYNDVDSVKERFPEYRKVVFPLTYSMATNSAKFVKNQSKRNELLLLNY